MLALHGQIALLVLVLVDVVAPGKGLVTCGAGDFSGSVIRDRFTDTPEARRLPYLVETETGDVIGRSRSYRDAAYLLAKHHGFAKPSVTVEIEHERD